MVVNFRSYINREIFCCFFAEQASLANTRVYNYKNEIKMALHCLSTSGVSGTKKMHILRTEFALISILPRKGKRIARFREEVYSWRDVKTGLDIIEKYSFFWKIGGRRTLPSQWFILFYIDRYTHTCMSELVSTLPKKKKIDLQKNKTTKKICGNPCRGFGHSPFCSKDCEIGLFW